MRPLNIALDITDRCNLKCVMCHFSNYERLTFPPYDPADAGNMPVELFEKIAAEYFPHSWRVALGCGAEPLMHPKFTEIVAIAGKHGVPDLWFPTNLLPLTERSAEAIVKAGVTTVAVSVDGITKETYEKIRIGGRWDKLMEKLELLRRVRREHRSRRPHLRIIFTWMQSNRHELRDVPAFAEAQGAREIDIRYVAPTAGVDTSAELLSTIDRAELNAELAAVAKDAVRRGLRLSSFPEYETPADRPRSLLGRVRRRAFRIRAGLERMEYWRHYWREQKTGCGYPDHNYVIRANGSVFPCIFWEDDPIGSARQLSYAEIAAGKALSCIRDGLAKGEPVGTCTHCTARRDAFYRPKHA